MTTEVRAGAHGRPMRGGGFCALDAAHRGRCASAAKCCDGCGKMRRGGGHSFEEGWFCFMCYGIYTTRRKRGSYWP